MWSRIEPPAHPFADHCSGIAHDLAAPHPQPPAPRQQFTAHGRKPWGGGLVDRTPELPRLGVQRGLSARCPRGEALPGTRTHIRNARGGGGGASGLHFMGCCPGPPLAPLSGSVPPQPLLSAPHCPPTVLQPPARLPKPHTSRRSPMLPPLLTPPFSLPRPFECSPGGLSHPQSPLPQSPGGGVGGSPGNADRTGQPQQTHRRPKVGPPCSTITPQSCGGVRAVHREWDSSCCSQGSAAGLGWVGHISTGA